MFNDVRKSTTVVVFNARTEVARHERVARGEQTINLDHYLEVLRHKPGAFPGSTVMARACDIGVFTAAHDAFRKLTRSRARSGGRQGRPKGPEPSLTASTSSGRERLTPDSPRRTQLSGSPCRNP